MQCEILIDIQFYEETELKKISFKYRIIVENPSRKLKTRTSKLQSTTKYHQITSFAIFSLFGFPFHPLCNLLHNKKEKSFHPRCLKGGKNKLKPFNCHTIYHLRNRLINPKPPFSFTRVNDFRGISVAFFNKQIFIANYKTLTKFHFHDNRTASSNYIHRFVPHIASQFVTPSAREKLKSFKSLPKRRKAKLIEFSSQHCSLAVCCVYAVISIDSEVFVCAEYYSTCVV